jgi:hypothetical protein
MPLRSCGPRFGPYVKLCARTLVVVVRKGWGWGRLEIDFSSSMSSVFAGRLLIATGMHAYRHTRVSSSGCVLGGLAEPVSTMSGIYSCMYERWLNVSRWQVDNTVNMRQFVCDKMILTLLFAKRSRKQPSMAHCKAYTTVRSLLATSYNMPID